MPGGHEEVKTGKGWGALGARGWDWVLLGKTGRKESEGEATEM